MLIRPALDPESEIKGARLKVRDPYTMAHLADEGEDKPATEYWLLRLREGGVEIVEPPLPPGDGTSKEAPAIGAERTEVEPGPDGTTAIAGGSPAEAAEPNSSVEEAHK